MIRDQQRRDDVVHAFVLLLWLFVAGFFGTGLLLWLFG
jgi:hypothetical protein